MSDCECGKEHPCKNKKFQQENTSKNSQYLSEYIIPQMDGLPFVRMLGRTIVKNLFRASCPN